jgi:hypothetical protein
MGRQRVLFFLLINFRFYNVIMEIHSIKGWPNKPLVDICAASSIISNLVLRNPTLASMRSQHYKTYNDFLPSTSDGMEFQNHFLAI